MSLNANSLSRYAALLVIAASAQIFSHKIQAQTGVSPSQTGLFFDDLRARGSQLGSGTVDEGAVTSSAGVYDFNEGEYTPENVVEERLLGESTPVEGAELERRIGEPMRQQGYEGGNTPRTPTDFTGEYAQASTYFAPAYISDPFLAGKRNLKLGPVNIGASMGTILEYNDNITSSSVNKVDDIIGSIYLNLDANYAITKDNRLSLALGVGIDHYFNHPEFAGNGKDYMLNVLPGTSLAFDFKVGDIRFVLYDRVSVRNSTQDNFALADYDVFGAVQNDLGLGAMWEVNSKTTLSMNVNRSDAWALEDAFSQYDRVITSISATLAYQPSGTYTIGLQTSYSWINYKENFNNDGTTFNLGVFFSTPISKSTFVKASAGIQQFKFDKPKKSKISVTETDILNTQYLLSIVKAQLAYASTKALREQEAYLENLLARQNVDFQSQMVAGGVQTFDDKDLSDAYYNFTVFNQLNQRVSHQLNIGRESTINTTSNYITTDYVNYGVGIIAWKGSRISLSTYWQRAEESGGFLAEDTDQWGFDISYSQRLTSQIGLGLGYHYGNTDSSVDRRSYEQHSFSVDLNYVVNQKMTLGLGYRYLTTEAENEFSSYDQNRLIMSANYNF